MLHYFGVDLELRCKYNTEAKEHDMTVSPLTVTTVCGKTNPEHEKTGCGCVLAFVLLPGILFFLILLIGTIVGD